jgi:hypothetical protein
VLAMVDPDFSKEAHATADARQALCLRASLVDEHRQLTAHLTKQRNEITKRVVQGHTSAIRRLRSQARSVEAELRYIDGLIESLDRRFDPAGQPPS